MLVVFINQVFLYHAKGVVGYPVFGVLELFEKLGKQDMQQGMRDGMQEGSISSWSAKGAIDPEIYAYLWTNLSSFIVYSRKKKKFYLKRGKNYMNDYLFLNLLGSLSKQC